MAFSLDHLAANVNRRARRLRRGARNALELLREGQLTEAWAAPYSVLHEERNYRLRRYVPSESVSAALPNPILLVPPLMVASEVYDISPEHSAVAWLTAQGADVWMADFGAPEHEEGGLQRTLDDHVLAVSDAIERVRSYAGCDVHLAGYSQGGMFVYQCAAYRRGDGIRSLITFGSPVDVHKNLPVQLRAEVSELILSGPAHAVFAPLKMMEGLPGFMSMAGFKILSGSKELQQILGLVRVLPDREALEKRERQRRFLGGEGFVAWPGPALSKFIDEMIVNNRMITGGFVIDGKTVTLADINVPILYFVGSRDEFGRPPSVRGIHEAAPNAEIHEVELQAGHFGLVVGSKSLRYTWPTVISWMRWRDGEGEQPDFAPEKLDKLPTPTVADGPAAYARQMQKLVRGFSHRLADAAVEAGEFVGSLRWSVPRLNRLRGLEEQSLYSIGSALREQARHLPDAPFLIFEGQAWTYAEVDRFVDRCCAVLLDQGVEPEQQVGVMMNNHPDFLMAVTALNRIGAVAVLMNANLRGASLEYALLEGHVSAVVADVDHIDLLLDACPELPLFVSTAEQGTLPESVVAINQLLGSADVTRYQADLDLGLAADVAMLIFTSGTTGRPKAVRITNRRWSMAALTTAAMARISPADTIYSVLPLYHATGMLMAAGGALVGGARLAIARRFSATGFFEETRRYGATVVFHVGELCRYLLQHDAGNAERQHSIRLFIGNGLRPDAWQELKRRVAPERIIEFYGSTEGNVALVNLSGDKIGSIGQPLNRDRAVALVHYDIQYEEFMRGDDGFMERCGVDEPGVLLARIDDSHPLSMFDGYTRIEETEKRILRNVFRTGDAWFSTGDLMRMDSDGDYWFLDRLGDTYRWHGENVSTEQVANVIGGLPFVANVIVYGVEVPGREGRAGMAAIELLPGAELNSEALYRAVKDNLSNAACPRFVRVVSEIPRTESMKLVKYSLRSEGVDSARISDPLLRYDARAANYLPLENAEQIVGID